ncbi:hypothetical protein OH76DRAFT_1214658 [Lentinus brumalis]|uniref:Uncharacterized protein n=1 Tax=Lentinus brumalis TaxID=2498619 RepID=A0A371DLF4_9APHY|nr:hypothetical protein OH76DRAFT_1214658 [Polyporus brumalis]
MPDRPRPHARLPGSSTPTRARLLSLASVLGPLTAAYRLRDLPWKLDEEQSYSYDTLLSPPWEDVFLDAWAALCSLHPHGSPVCASLRVHTATVHELLIATPGHPSAPLQEMVECCLRELTRLSSTRAHDPAVVGLQESGDEFKFVATAYTACHAAHREMVELEGPTALSTLDRVIDEVRSGKCPPGGEDIEDGDEWVEIDNFLGEAGYDPPRRAVRSSDAPWLNGLRQALSSLVSAVRDKDEDWLAIYRCGVDVLSYVEDRELAPVLRGIGMFELFELKHLHCQVISPTPTVSDWPLRMTLLRKICALPWAVVTLLHISRSFASLQKASPSWSVSWIHPSSFPSSSPSPSPSPTSTPSASSSSTPTPPTPTPSSTPTPTLCPFTTEALADELLTACPDISREDCIKIVERGHYCCDGHRFRDASAPHPEAILIEHIVKNNLKVHTYLATSPVSPMALPGPWSCFACARLLAVVNARHQTGLALRGVFRRSGAALSFSFVWRGGRCSADSAAPRRRASAR